MCILNDASRKEHSEYLDSSGSTQAVEIHNPTDLERIHDEYNRFIGINPGFANESAF